MRRLALFAAVVVAGAGAMLAQADGIGFNLTITGPIIPGVYGHVVIGNRPPPPVVYARPLIIMQPPPGVVVGPPIYLHVPPDYARHWRLHCREFHACNRPVYFVRSAEYEPGFNMERWRREHPGYYRRDWDRPERGRGWDRGRGHDHDRGRDHDHRDRHDHRDHGDR